MPKPDPVFDLLTSLAGTFLRWSWEGTSRIEHGLQRVARAYGRQVETGVLADSVMLTSGTTTAVVAGHPDVPGLDQVAEARKLVDDIDSGGVEAGQALARLNRIQAMAPRYPVWARMLGMSLFSVGFSLSVQATWQELVCAAVGSLILGLLISAGWRRPRFMAIVPLLAAVAVSTTVLLLYQHEWLHGGPIQLMVPVLLYFIPGDVLTAAVLELADGRLTAGAARLVYGGWMLLQLGFGAMRAALLTRTPQNQIFDTEVVNSLPRWVVWLGWVAFAAGVLLLFSMRPRDFPYALATILVTAGVAQLGTAALGETAGTFVGAVVMTLTVLLLARKPSRPPRYVLFIGAFFVLTPGSRGLFGLESWIGGQPIDGVHDVADMLGMLAALALGIFVTVTLIPRRFLFDQAHG